MVRASDSRPGGLGSMPNAIKYPPSTHESHGKIVGVEISGVAIYRPFGEFRHADSNCHLKTVRCALWAGGIIGPYFFETDEGHNVTVNGDRYRAMITNFFIPELNNHDVQELWFQQDGATCHTARATIDLLKDTFGDRLISRFGPVNWPPRSLVSR
ncbi:putative transposable element [Trichonephila clavipes]|nr:putative transposable element [Trichonephila clavipes]